MGLELLTNILHFAEPRVNTHKPAEQESLVNARPQAPLRSFRDIKVIGLPLVRECYLVLKMAIQVPIDAWVGAGNLTVQNSEQVEKCSTRVNWKFVIYCSILRLEDIDWRRRSRMKHFRPRFSKSEMIAAASVKMCRSGAPS